MLSSRYFRLLVRYLLLTVCLSGIIGSFVAFPIFAQTPSPSATPAPELVLDTRYPALSADVGSTFSFDVDIKYYDTQRTTFNLVATAPSGFTTAITGNSYTQISAIDMAAYDTSTPGIETVTVTFTPDYSNLPQPGVYKGNLKVTNGTLTENITLRATVIARYSFTVDWTDPSTGSTTTDVTMLGAAGKTSNFPFDVTNNGSAEIKNLTFSADAPKGWNVTFTPATLPSLATNQTQQVSALVTPPSGGNRAGDYVLTLNGENGSISAKMILRVSIPPTNTSVWLIVGIAAAIIVVLALIYQFLGKKKPKPQAKAS
jgi:uncharacterized membrane protein